MILKPFRGIEKVGSQEHEGRTEVPEFLEKLGLEKLNFKFLHELFSLFAKFEDRFPELNISLRGLFGIVQKNKDFFAEVYNSSLKLYLEGRITLEELLETIQTYLERFKNIIEPYLLTRQEGKISPGIAVFLFLIGLAILVLLVVGGFGYLGVAQLPEIRKLIEAFDKIRNLYENK